LAKNTSNHNTSSSSDLSYSYQSQALEGLKILDFCWVAIGPMTTRYLADHGATVIRIETPSRLDILRNATPFKEGIAGVNRSGYFATMNANKLAMTVDLKRPEGLEVIKKLVSWADVVTENFTPGTMEKLNLGFSELQKINPSIIMFSTSMFGRGGPHSSQPGLGPVLTSLAGFTHLTGWPDRAPVSPYGAYTDFFLPHFAISGIIAALDYREETGVGQHLDMSQLEGAIHLLTPTLLEYSINGHIPMRSGNNNPNASPHGVFPCKDNDTWCALACLTETQWNSLANLIGKPALRDNPNFRTLRGRKENERELESYITSWTSNYFCSDLMNKLLAEGIPAGMVNACSDLLKDPQLTHRKHFTTRKHPVMEEHLVDGNPMILSDTPGTVSNRSPLLGEHNEYVLETILGMDAKEIASLKATGVFD